MFIEFFSWFDIEWYVEKNKIVDKYFIKIEWVCIQQCDMESNRHCWLINYGFKCNSENVCFRKISAEAAWGYCIIINEWNSDGLSIMCLTVFIIVSSYFYLNFWGCQMLFQCWWILYWPCEDELEKKKHIFVYHLLLGRWISYGSWKHCQNFKIYCWTIVQSQDRNWSERSFGYGISQVSLSYDLLVFY